MHGLFGASLSEISTYPSSLMVELLEGPVYEVEAICLFHGK
jgi:hypothetical protein